MARLSPNTVVVLRWIAFLPAVLLLSATGWWLAIAIEAVGGVWAAFASRIVGGLGLTLALVLGSRVAPSRSRLAILLAAAALALSAVPLLAVTWRYRNALWIVDWPLIVASGIGIGAFLAWRRARLEPRRVAPAAASKSARYKGTAPYQDVEIDRKTFFGRDRESRSLRSLVLAERLVVLFAKSGMGKTSLINAGLVEPLREQGYLPLVVRLADRERGPLASVLDGVRAAADVAGVEVVGGDDSSAWRFFKTAEFWSQRDDLLRPVLIVDQFEELFTLHAPGPRREFIGQLAELVRGRAAAGRGGAAEPHGDAALGSGPPELKIVLSMREDFLADLEELAGDIPGILHRRFRLGPLTAKGAREAIVGPALLADEAFDSLPFSYRDEAVERIIAFLARRRHGTETVESDEVEPVQLQLVCQYLEELVQARPPADGAGAGIEISAADLGDETRLRRVLESFYDRTVAAIRSPWERRRVRRLCERRLISGSGRRLTEDGEEIVKRHKVSKQRLLALVNARLLRPEPRLGGLFYELSHDTLVGPVQQSRKKRILRRRLEWGGVVAVLLIYATGWWLATREVAAYQKAVQMLPDPREAFEPLVVERLDRIEAGATRWLRNRQRFGEVAVLLQDAIRLTRSRTSRERAEELADRLLEEFRKAHDIDPPPLPADDQELNRRVPIEGGTFEAAGFRVTLSPFVIQEHEVTNEEYRRFDRDHGFEAGAERHPAVGVDWYEAMAYAAWLGGSLPTEAQWELAARGREGREFPWGSEDPDCDRAQFDECEPLGSVPVCSKALGKTPETGLCDLAGNAWEWCRDRLSRNDLWQLIADPEGRPRISSREQSDPVGPTEGEFRAVRGGSFEFDSRALRGGARHFSQPHEGAATGGVGLFALGHDGVGFRVAWAGPGAAGLRARSAERVGLLEGR